MFSVISSTSSSMSTLGKTVRAGLATLLIGQLLFLSGSMDWQAYLMILGVYLATTATCGWDPLTYLLPRGKTKAVSYSSDFVAEKLDGTRFVDFKAANESRRAGRGGIHAA